MLDVEEDVADELVAVEEDVGKVELESNVLVDNVDELNVEELTSVSVDVSVLVSVAVAAEVSVPVAVDVSVDASGVETVARDEVVSCLLTNAASADKARARIVTTEVRVIFILMFL